jgi:hypothetical protein
MDEKSELIKEVFTRFGTAYFESEVLHRGLCNIYVFTTFDKPESITKPRIDEKLKYAYSLTLGQVIKESKQHFPIEIQDQLDIALNKRNYLAHNFWFNQNHLMFDEQGLARLQNELIDLTTFFDELDKVITGFYHPIRQYFGITDEMVQEINARLLQGEEDEPLIAQRLPKKKERLVKVWDVEVNDGLITQIFETDDGNLWQLSDVGLGWTKFNTPEPNWHVNEIFQKHLPATINPRPSISESWKYEFQLANDAVFWVKPGKKKKSYAWGINEHRNTSR